MKNEQPPANTTAEISAVNDWKPHVWDVLLDFGDCALAIEWPRDKRPEIGEVVTWDRSNGVIWRGSKLAIDVRSPRVDENGNLYFA